MSKETFSSTVFKDKAATTKRVWRWRVYYYDRTGDRKAKSGRAVSQKEAKREVAAMQSELLKGADFSRRDVGFSDYFDDYLARYKRGRAAKSTQRHYDAFSNTISGYWGDTLLREVTPDSWQDFINDYAQGHSLETTQKIAGHVHSMVKVAQANGIIQLDFAAHVTYPVPREASSKEVSKRKRALELDDLHRLKQYIYATANFGKITAYQVAIGIGTGMRYAEVAGLSWSAISFSDNTIKVVQTWDYKDPNADDPNATKTESSERTIDVAPELVQLLKRLKIEQEIVFKRQGYADRHQLVCRTSRHTVPTDNGVNKQLDTYQDAVGIDEDHKITFHGLRHSQVAYLAAKNIDIFYISKRLGHKDVGTTMRRYYHLLKHVETEQSKKAVAALAAL